MPYAQPLPDTYPPDMDFMPVTPRNWVPAGGHWDNAFKESMMLSCLKHCPGGPHAGNEFMLAMASIFKEYCLNEMHFYSRLALSENKVYVNIYSDHDRLVLFCANLSKSAEKIELELPSELVSDGKKLQSAERIRNIKILDHSADLTKFYLECQSENAGVIELKRS